jgi:hypothetical protein
MTKERVLKRFIALLPILVLVAFALQMTVEFAPSNLAPANLASANQQRAAEPVILVVLDAPSNFDGVASGLGFRLLSEEKMDQLGTSAKTIAVPMGKNNDDAKKMLLQHFPELIIGSSDLTAFAL